MYEMPDFNPLKTIGGRLTYLRALADLAGWILARRPWLEVVAVEGNILIRIDGYYSPELVDEMQDYWAKELSMQLLNLESEAAR